MGNHVRRLYYCTISFSYSYAGSVFRVFFAVNASLTPQTWSSEHSTCALGKHSAGRNIGLAFPHHRQTTGEKAGSCDGGCASCPLAQSTGDSVHVPHTFFSCNKATSGLDWTQSLKLVG